jgi:CRISPR-associated protein Cmr3
MSTWTITPRDPLVLRDGRPNQGQSESATVAFPYPSTVAGVLRTRLGSTPDGRFIASASLDALRAVHLRGPLLTQAQGGGLWLSAPRDVLVVNDSDQTRTLVPLTPQEVSDDVLLDDGAPREVPVPVADVGAQKVADNLPRWWSWQGLRQWLEAPAVLRGPQAEALLADGLGAMPRETRVHVKLSAEGVAEESMLFETTGLRLHDPRREGLDANRGDLALLIDVVDTHPFSLREGVAAFGGERRLVRWAKTSMQLPEMPDAVRRAITAPHEQVCLRLVLLTPAHFVQGSVPSLAPGTVLGPREGVTVNLRAAVVPRPETISGWDFATQRPKPTRRLVSGGSVYWLTLRGEPAARLRWAESVWMQNVSDDEQACRDGFGLAVLGVCHEKG